MHWQPKTHRAGCALNSRGNCVFILSDNVELIIVALKLTQQNSGGGWISLTMQTDLKDRITVYFDFFVVTMLAAFYIYKGIKRKRKSCKYCHHRTIEIHAHWKEPSIWSLISTGALLSKDERESLSWINIFFVTVPYSLDQLRSAHLLSHSFYQKIKW